MSSMAASLLLLVLQEGIIPWLPRLNSLMLTFLRSIGAAICRALARFPLKGMALHYSQSAQAIEHLRESLHESFPSMALTLHQADLSQPSHCDKLVQEVLQAHGKVDIFVSNAGAAKRITDIL